MHMLRRFFLGLTCYVFGRTTRAQSAALNATASDSELTAQDRLDRCTKLYKNLQTYRDQGSLTQEFAVLGRPVKSKMTFSTAFERGGRFYWQFRHSATPGAEPDQQFEIWSNDSKSFDYLWTLTGKHVTSQKLDMPLATATGISSGAATAIIPLLHVEEGGSRWGLGTTKLSEPEEEGQENVNQVSCWKISGHARLGDSKVTLWIDEDGLIRKIFNETVVDPSKTPAGAAQAIPKMPAFTTYTTINFTPVINEVKIDDSKFKKSDR